MEGRGGRGVICQVTRRACRVSPVKDAPHTPSGMYGAETMWQVLLVVYYDEQPSDKKGMIEPSGFFKQSSMRICMISNFLSFSFWALKA